MNIKGRFWSAFLEEDWVILNDCKSLKWDVALKCESRNFRKYFEKTGEAIVDHWRWGIITYNGTETYGRRGELRKKYSHKGELNEKSRARQITPKNIHTPEKNHTRKMITKKNSCISKVLQPP